MDIVINGEIFVTKSLIFKNLKKKLEEDYILSNRTIIYQAKAKGFEKSEDIF